MIHGSKVIFKKIWTKFNIKKIKNKFLEKSLKLEEEKRKAAMVNVINN